MRDIDEIMETGLPIYARGAITLTARNRTIEESTNEMIEIGGIQVRPDDVIVGDRSGVVVIPQEHLETIVKTATEIQDRESQMIADLRAGMSILDVDTKYSYEQMLNPKAPAK